jgi:hypothetical protein
VLLLSARAVCGAAAPQQTELPTLIVTVIDPADPRLAYLYHRELESVLAALNNVGFIKTAVPDGGIWSGADGGVRVGTIDLKRWPRSGSGPVTGLSQHLKLFLVPERQYGGVEPSALEFAVAQSDGGPIYVLGPVLSGSAWSLVAGLKAARARSLERDGCVESDAARKSDRLVEIISGSASASDLVGILAKAASPGRARVTVHSTMDLVRGVKGAICDFCGTPAFRFCDQTGAAASGHEIALFVETSTFYGQSFVNDVRNELNALVLPFPAGLADRLGEDPFGEGPSSGQEGKPSDTSPRRTEINIREASAALDELLRTLAFEEIRTVGILATDVRDRLVLVQKVRRLLPGVKVILFESDILYSQAPDEAMRGTLVASTYPLFAENQGWTSGHEAESRRERMVSDPSEGAYNAMLLLLGDMDADMDQSLALDAGERLVEYRSPAFAAGLSPEAPPVWISVLGTRGSWPLAIRDVDGGTRGIVPRNLASSDFALLDFAHPDFASRDGAVEIASANIRFATIASAGILPVDIAPPAFARAETSAASAASAETTTVDARSPAFIAQQRRQQALSPRWLKPAPTPFRGLVVLTLLAAAGIVAWLWRRPDRTSLVWLVILGATSLVLAFEGVLLYPPVAFPGLERIPILSLAALALALLVPIVAGWRCTPDPAPTWWSTCAVLLMDILVVALVAMMMGFFRLEPERLAPFLVRATHIESGLSPIPPLLLVYTALLVSLFTILSLRRLDEPSLFPVRKGTKLRLVVAGGVLVWAWYLWNQFRPMVEIAPLGLIFRAVYALAPLTLIWTFMVSVQAAASLRQVLDQIADEASRGKAKTPPDTTWDRANTLASFPGTSRHLVLARASDDFPFQRGRSFEGAFGAREAFRRAWGTAIVIRRRLVRPLFVTPLLVVGLATYPFEPRGLLLLTYGTLLTVFVVGTVIYTVQIENHPGAAALRGDAQERRALDLGLLVRVSVAVIPALLTLIGAGLPSTGQKIFGWVDQVLTMFK